MRIGYFFFKIVFSLFWIHLTFWQFEINAQPAELSLENAKACPGNSFLVPLKGKNLQNVGAITLYIYYNPLQFEFVSIENIDPKIGTLLYYSLSDPSRISIVWSSVKGVSFDDDTLLELRFQPYLLTGNLNFAVDSCELAAASIPPVIIPVIFSNSQVTPATATITTHPENKTVAKGSNVSFNVDAPDADHFQWQELFPDTQIWHNLEDGGHYQGVTTSILTLIEVPNNFDKYSYRCLVFKNNCRLPSSPALLSVDTAQSIRELVFSHATASPNPFSTHLFLSYRLTNPGKIIVEGFSIPEGKIFPVSDLFQEAGDYDSRLNFVYLPIGLYGILVTVISEERVEKTFFKVLKNCE